MRGVGPGTVLGGRYTVHRRLEQLHDTERWSADDTTLGRSVSVLCMAAYDHRAPALLDAARRAGSVTHAVFVRILDVGTDDDVSYVVEEDLGEARTLAALVSEGGVPGDEVRRITGEVAAALESARQRGMHHLDLKPDDVLRTPDGDVRLRGLETAAVRSGQDGAESEDAARRDAVGVVALAYAGLTGLWPLGAGGAGLGAAPRVPGGVAAPSEIAAGVPRDLDAICRLTLNDDQGPTSPGDYARQVAPWPSRQVIGRPVSGGTGGAGGAGAGAAGAGAGAAGAGAAGAGAASAGAAADGATEVRSEHDSAPAASVTLEQPALPTPEVAAAGEAPSAPVEDAPGAVRRKKRPLGRRSAAAGAAGVAGVAAGAAGSSAATAASGSSVPRAPRGPGAVDDGEATRVLPSAESTPDWLRETPDAPERTEVARHPHVGHHPPQQAEADARHDVRRDADERQDSDEGARTRGAAAGGAVAGAGAAVAGAFGSVGGRMGGMARRAVDRVSELSPDTAPRRTADGLEAPAPLVPAEPLTKDESKLALGIVAGFLVLALVIGIWGVSRIGSNSGDLFGDSAAAPATRTTTVAPSSPAPSGSASEPAEGTGPAEPLAILKVEAYDPEGDGEENNKLTPKVYDGDETTGWFSENYRTEEFGGLKKGVGVIVDLGPNKKPQTVELVIPVAGDVEVHVGPDNRLEGATKVGEKAGARGTVKFDVPADVSGQYIVVWFTGLTTDDEGKRRAWLNEVVVTG